MVSLPSCSSLLIRSKTWDRSLHQPPPCQEFSPPGCPSLPLLPVWMNIPSLPPRLSDSHTVVFSGSSGYFLLLNWLSFFWVCKEAKCIYLHFHLGLQSKSIYWRRYKIQETLYIGQWCLSPLQSRHLGTSHSFPDHPHLPCPTFLDLILVWGKARSHRAPNLGCSRAESPGWFDVLSKNSSGDMMPERAYCCDEAASCQLPIAMAFWIIQIASTETCSRLTQNVVQIHCSTHSVILNVTATQYTCTLNGVYHPHWLAQWSHHCSHMCIPVHSPWMPGYIDVCKPFSLY